ncbi:MAG: bifunctional nuclease family protein [Planctomycetota bacterium]
MLNEVQLFQVIMTDGVDTQVIVLKETAGDRQLPIFIGASEARAIERKVKDVPAPRPLTHDLIMNIIEKMGGAISRVLIHDLRDETYYASVEINQDGEIREIDARPSDAIALAVRSGVAIFVAECVFERTTKKPDVTIL